jgi:GNAT superfamily N-acetyltransferase
MQAELLRVGDVVIREHDLASSSDDDVRAITAFRNAMRAEVHADDPPWREDAVAIDVRSWPPFMRHRTFIGRDDDGAIVASAVVSWAVVEDNQHIVNLDLGVLPAYRRRGIGTALLERAVAVSDESGRPLIVSQSIDLVGAGEAFARRMDAKLGMAQGMNRLVLADVDRDRVRRWIQQGPIRAEGYSLVAVDGRYPDELVEQIVDLSAVMNTAPRDDLEMEDEVPTVKHSREWEETNLPLGIERWYLAARHDATGQLVGWTEVGWWPTFPTTVWQWGTGVRPEHRGHAIGKWLKAVMLERILDERPDAIDIRTTNADSNDAMLGINHALGFRKYHTHLWWQLPAEKAKAYLAELGR